jgi:hypothetical protein
VVEGDPHVALERLWCVDLLGKHLETRLVREETLGHEARADGPAGLGRMKTNHHAIDALGLCVPRASGKQRGNAAESDEPFQGAPLAGASSSVLRDEPRTEAAASARS